MFALIESIVIESTFNNLKYDRSLSKANKLISCLTLPFHVPDNLNST